jgi:hypothetical protein
MNEIVGNATTSRRSYLRVAGAVGIASMTGLAGCTGSDGDAATGTLSTAVKDAPGDISDFESCVVSIQGFWLKASNDEEDETDADNETAGADDGADNETADMDGEDSTEEETEEVEEQDEEDVDESGNREYHEYDEAQEADLVQLQDGETQLIDDREIDVGTYEYLQLDVSGVAGTLSGGEETDVGTPGNAPLQFKHEFDVREDQETTFTADFTPVKRGRTGKYLLQPVAKGIEVTYSDETESE